MLTICVGKSTYARCGIIVNVTPFEPEWEGFVTLEISNTTPLPARIYANEGLCQILFFQSDEVCETSYKDKTRKVPGAKGHRAAQAVTKVASGWWIVSHSGQLKRIFEWAVKIARCDPRHRRAVRRQARIQHS